LARVAATLQHFNELRDMGGDMRVDVYAAATASNAKASDDAAGEIAGTDEEVDGAVAGLDADLAAMPGRDRRTDADVG
jgi:hypothetical protein